MLFRVQPSQADANGWANVGELMKMVDMVAGACAIRHSNCAVATVSVDDMVFRVPLEVGDMVALHSRIVFTGRTSMSIRIDVDVEKKLASEKLSQVITADFVVIATGEDGKPLPVPPLIVRTDEEKALYEQARAEYEARKVGSGG